MSTSDNTYIASTSDLPEVRPFDGSGADKYYVPPEQAKAALQTPHPERKGTQFAETGSTLPERRYKDEDKQAYEITYPVGYLEQKKAEQRKDDVSTEQKDTTHFRIKKVHLIWAAVTVLVVVLAVVLGTVLGLRTRSSANPTPTPTPTSTSTSGLSPPPSSNSESAVGGYLNADYYSKSGAFNGTGVAIASVSDPFNRVIYGFYQDHEGLIQLSLLDAQRRWNKVGPVNEDSYAALNGTPISVINHEIDDELLWHIIYIDQTYIVRERYISNSSSDSPIPTWRDGPLSNLNLKTMEADRIGMTACYMSNYYAQSAGIAPGIMLWYASDETVMQQYSWSNGTSNWVWDRSFTDVNGHASFGCQTRDTGMTEYIFFVNKNQEIAFWWIDNNRSAVATDSHPVGEWAQGKLNIASVYKASPIAYTRFLVYQSIDTSIRGVNITFAAENTTVGQGAWILTSENGTVPVMAGTQLAFSNVNTLSNETLLLALFQEHGDDVSMYIHDVSTEGGVWQPAPENLVEPSS